MRDLFRFLFRIRNLALFLVLLALSMSLVVNYNMHQRAQAISSSNVVVGKLYGWRTSVTEFASLGEVNKDLADALAREREQRFAVKVVRDSGEVIEDTVRHLRYRFITAQVINSTVHKEKNYILLNKGEADGVKKDRGVIGANGIVGMVREAGPDYALVYSVASEEISYSVQLRGTKHFGLLRWDGDPRYSMFADLDKHVPVHKGDTVETRGQGLFPLGTMVGVVDTVINDPSIPFHTVTVRLSEDLTRSGYVFVVEDLTQAQRAPLDSTLAAP